MPIDHLHSRDFAECVHTRFELHAPSGETIPFELMSVTEKEPAPRQEQFTLLFHGPAAPALAQQIVPLRHPKLGELNLFFVPLGPKDGVMEYEVVFNRLRRDSASKSGS